MRRTTPWIGIPVVDFQSGKERGRVCDLLFQGHDSLYGLLIREKTWLHDAAYVPYSGVAAIGEDAVMLVPGKLPQKLDHKALECWYWMTGSSTFKGKLIYSKDGDLLGEVADVYIEENSDRMLGYEISDGLLADLLNGRKFLPANAVEQIGDHMIVLTPPIPIPKHVH